MKPSVDTSIKNLLTERLIKLEEHFDSDFLVYYGPIVDGNENIFLKIVEDIASDAAKKDKIYVMLTTSGGSAVAVERYVNILRHHYNEVNFIIPDCAYSAGTIFCMSGDNILMDYFSVLGYLDKVNELIEKAKSTDPVNQLSQAEFLILKDIDLAELRGYEQAKNLTIELLKKWLVKYKFKNWSKHNTNQLLLGQDVTSEEKEERAKEIADKLSDSNHWKSHGRPINIETLESKPLRLIIEDYSKEEYRKLIRQYYDLFFDYVTKNGHSIFIQTRKFI